MRQKDEKSNFHEEELNSRRSVELVSTNEKARDRSVRLIARDKELLAHVAAARYLNYAQLRSLVFDRPLRSGAGKSTPLSDAVARRRLPQLCGAGGGTAYLRALSYRTADGTRLLVYAVTAHGYAVARSQLRVSPGVPSTDVKHQFLEHATTLNQLYVGLARAARAKGIPIREYPFTWRFTEEGGLPWTELANNGRTAGRRLQPDAILELPARGGSEAARVFVECEMGGHPIWRSDESHTGSVMSKVRRYAAYVTMRGDDPRRTFYQQRFGDNVSPELVFLMDSPARREHVSESLRAWRATNARVPLHIQARGVDEATDEYATRAGLFAHSPSMKPPVRAHRSLSADEVRAIRCGVAHVEATFKGILLFLQKNGAAVAAGCPVPQSSRDFESLRSLAQRLADAEEVR